MDTPSTPPPPASPAPKPKSRKLRKYLLVAAIAPILLVLGLPHLASLGPARRALLSYVNGPIAPARIELRGMQLSWFSPIRVDGFALVNREGRTLLAAPHATLDRSLLQLLSDRPRYGTLTVEGATIDLERRADGTIDLVEVFSGAQPGPVAPASAPSSGGHADEAVVTVKVKDGTLRLRSPELLEPFRAERMDVTLEVPPAPAPLSWTIRLANGTDGTAESLELSGHYDHRSRTTSPGDAEFQLKAKRWPFAARRSGLTARGRLEGTLGARLRAGSLALDGDAALREFESGGPALGGDRLQLDRVAAKWDLARIGEAWTVRRLDVSSPVATLSASGGLSAAPASATRLDGRVDLAALSRQLPHALRLREGLALDRGDVTVRLDLRPEADGQHLVAEARLSDLAARDGAKAIALREPATLSADVTRSGRTVRVGRLDVRSGFLTLKGSGDLERGVSLSGTGDLGELETQFRDLIDFGGVSLAGKVGLAADYRRRGADFLGRFAVDVRHLKVAGLSGEPVEREAVRIDGSASGPADASGLPLDWRNAKLGLKSGATGAGATASRDADGAIRLAAQAASVLALAGHDTRAEATVAGRWGSQFFEIGQLHATLLPAGPDAKASLSIDGAGRFDAKAGDLRLAPTGPAQAQARAVGLGAGGLHVEGLGAGGGPLKLEAVLAGDLAALDLFLAEWAGSARRGLAGAWTSGVKIGGDREGNRPIEIGLASADLSREAADGKDRRAEGPLGILARGTYRADGDRFLVDELTVGSRYGRLTASGRVDEPGGRRVADLQGTLDPNWPAVTSLVASAVEPGVRLKGGAARPFRVKGPLSGDTAALVLKGLDAEIGVDLAEAEAFGVVLGKAPLVLRCQSGRATFDPIRTTLSGGQVDLAADLNLEDPHGLALRLAAGSRLDGVQVNDEISKRVLSFVAPVLDQATHVQGRVSASFDGAEFPIGGDDGRTMTILGRVAFDDVAFAAGPLAKQLLAVVGKGGTPALRLHQPVLLTVADGRVNQKGLAIPIARDATIDVEGSVGFDRTLALRAVVPITGAMLGGQQGLEKLVGGTKVAVPIGGTLSEPRLDVRALRVALRDASKGLLKQGASGLLDRLVSPAPAAGGGAGQPDAGAASPEQRLGDELFRRLVPRRGTPAMPR